MNKFSRFFSRIGEGIKNAVIAIFAGSILSTIVIYLFGLSEVIKSYEDASTLIFLILFFLSFAVPAIVPYFVAGIIAEFLKLPSWGVIILTILTLFCHRYVSVRYGFVSPVSIESNFFISFVTYIPVFMVFLFVSLYQRGKPRPEVN